LLNVCLSQGDVICAALGGLALALCAGVGQVAACGICPGLLLLPLPLERHLHLQLLLLLLCHKS
jgi:hypothetical protein